MKSLVIIPAYNEEKSILNTVADIKKNAPDFDYIIINDCSQDKTLQLCKDAGIPVINLPINLGIGGAVQYIAYALPVLLVTAGKLSAIRISRKK